jgi:hypothetical protein
VTVPPSVEQVRAAAERVQAAERELRDLLLAVSEFDDEDDRAMAGLAYEQRLAEFIAACRTDAPLLAAWATKAADALAEIVRREARSEYSSIYAAPGEFAAIARDVLDAVLSVGGGNKADA